MQSRADGLSLPLQQEQRRQPICRRVLTHSEDADKTKTSERKRKKTNKKYKRERANRLQANRQVYSSQPTNAQTREEFRSGYADGNRQQW